MRLDACFRGSASWSVLQNAPNPVFFAKVAIVALFLSGHSAQAQTSLKQAVENAVRAQIAVEQAQSTLVWASQTNAANARQQGVIDIRWEEIQAERSYKKNFDLLQQNYSVLNGPIDQDSLYKAEAELLPTNTPTIPISLLNPSILEGTAVPTTNLKSGKHIPASPIAIGLFNPQKVDRSPIDYLMNMSSSFVSTLAEVDDIDFLGNPEHAFVRKMEILTGYTLPASVMATQNVAHKIDYSKAPQFKEILVSTLFLRADFTGTLFSDALMYHARRGTQVRLMMSASALFGLHFNDPVNRNKDLALYAKLSATPNIQIQKVGFHEPDYSPTHTINEIHRAHHAKIMIFVYEKSALNRTIVGGRNLSDAYTFQQAPDHTEFPQLIQYKTETYMPVEDIEVETKGNEITQSSRAQYLAFWNRDPVSLQFRNPFKHLPSSALADLKTEALVENFDKKSSAHKVFARHFWHVPFQNVGTVPGLEDMFVQMIDSAKTSVQIVTPYFNMPDKLEAALKRASKRGVTIQAITNASLSGDDFLPNVVTAANKIGMRVLAQDIEFATWANSKIMLHSKMMLVDSELMYVGSVNFNRRSFSHDVENGLLLMGKEPILRFFNLFHSRYMPKTEPLSRSDIFSDVGTLNSAIITIFNSFF